MVRLSFSRLEPVALMRLTHLSKAEARQVVLPDDFASGLAVVEQFNQLFLLLFTERSSCSFFGHGFSLSFIFKRIPLPYLFCTV